MNDLSSVILNRLEGDEFIAKPAEIKALRERMRLKPIEAAKLISVSRRTWERYEYGELTMNQSTWLFLLLLAGEVQGLTVLNMGG